MPGLAVPILPSRDLRETLTFYAWVEKVVPDPPTGSRLVSPVETDYAMREFAVVDRSGTLIRIGSPT